MLRVQRFESLGFGFDDFLIHVHGLPAGFGIDGLLGLSFLKKFKLRDQIDRESDLHPARRRQCHLDVLG
jgi:hypothetical protein